MKVYYKKAVSLTSKSNPSFRRFIRLSLSLAILVFFISSYLLLVKKTSAAWYDDSFAYRQKITFGNTGSADANKKVKLDIDTATLISAGKMQSDCDDSRFTDFNGRQLKYYLDTAGGACNTSSTDFYVLVPTINSGATDLLFYYGNPFVSSGSQATQFSESTFAPTSGPTASSEEKSTGPIGYWKMDEGYGTTTQDGAPTNNDGTLSGPIWQQNNQCLSGKCLFFDGSNDVMTIPAKDTSSSSTITYEDTVSVAGSGTSVTTGTVSGGTNQLYVMSAAVRSNRNVTAVSGLSLTWTEQIDQCSGRGQTEVAIWTAFGSPSSGTVQVTVGSSSNAIEVSVSRYSNADPTTPISAPGGQNTNGASGTCTLGTDSSAAQVSLTSTVNGSVHLVSTGPRGKTISTPDGDYTERANNLAGSGGDSTRLYVHDKTMSTAGADTANHTLSGNEDWVMAGVVINPIVTTTTNQLDLNRGLSGGFSISAWVFANSDGEGDVGQIFQKGTNTYLRVDSESNGNLDVEASLDLATTDATLNVSSAIKTNSWNHIVLSWTDDGDDEITIYVNGKNVGSSTNGSGATATDTNDILLGGTTTANFHGRIDEFKIYPFELSTSQVLANTQSRGGLKGTSAVFGVNNIDNLSNGMVGYWKMDETSGNRSDSSGNSLTLTDTNTVTSNAGKYNYSGQFTSTNSEYLTTSNNTILDVEDEDLTFAAWIYLDSLGTQRSVAGKLGNTFRGWRIRTNTSNQILFQIYDTGGSARSTTSSTILTSATWYHVAGIYDTVNNKIKLYVNGVNEDTYSLTTDIGSNSTGNFTIGALDTGGISEYWDGRIDEARYYKVALTPAQIQNLYSSGPGPVGHYDFNEKSGASAQDKSGNDNTVTISGATYTLGKFGAGLDFDGIDDNVTRADDSDYDFAASENFTVSTWVKHDGVISTNEDYILTKADTSNGGYKLYMDNSGDFCFDIDDDSSWTPDDTACTSAVDYDDSSWHYVTGVKTGTSRIDLFVDGKLVASDSSISATGTLANSNAIYFGVDRDGTSKVWDGAIDETKIYNYARTPAQIIEDMNGGHPMGGSPVGSQVAYWQIDEGYGTNVNDTTTNNNDLTMSTASWTNSGKFGKAWNGTNANWLSRADDADFDFAENEDFTISLWIKSDSASNPATTEYLVDKESTSAGYAIYANTNGTICFAIDDDATWTPDISSCSTTDFYDGTWHHITGIRDYSGSDKTYIYIDGKPIANTSDTTTATLANADSLTIGDRNATNDGDEFTGDIDDIKIYRGTLTTDEILIDYNRGSSAKFGSISDNSTYQKDAANQEYCVPGDSTSCASPIGEWKMDEASWTNDCSTDTVFDTSGNGNHGDSCPNSTGPTGGTIPGQIGKAGTFDGSDEYVDLYDTMNASLSTTYTVSVWIKTTTVAEGNVIASYRSTSSSTPIYFQMDHNNADARFVVRDGAGNIATASFASALTANTWYHITGVRNGNTTRVYVNGIEGTSATATIGSISHDKALIGGIVTGVGSTPQASTLFKGTIDNLRIYNYVRTPAQIAWEYNRGAPLAHYKLDECSGSTTNNSISSSYPGTITIGASGSNTSTGTCSSGTSTEAWNNGTTGKFNSSLDFDGTDDYVSIADNANLDFNDKDFSLTGWFYRDSATTDDVVIAKRNGIASGDTGYILYLDDSTDQLIFEVSDGTDEYSLPSTSTFTSTGWYHFAVVWDDDSASGSEIYINGYDDDAVDSGTIGNIGDLSNAVSLVIGSESDLANYFIGQLDDVRLYNYALTQNQIKNIMNQGASVRFGPQTGAP